jgi:replication factor A1
VVALKAMRVGDFNGKNLGSCSSSTVLIDPDRPEAVQLRNW